MEGNKLFQGGGYSESCHSWARRKILYEIFDKVKNGAGKQGGFWPESLGNRKPCRSGHRGILSSFPPSFSHRRGIAYTGSPRRSAGFFGFLQCDGTVGLLQICNYSLDALVTDISGGTAYLVDDAALQPAFGEDGLNGLHHPTQAVRAEQIYIQNTPAFEVIQHIQPEFAIFALSDPDSQNILPAVHGDTKDHIGSLGHVPPVFPDLVVNGVHEHERIHRLQRTVLPGYDRGHDFFADLRYQLRRDLHTVQFLDLLGDIPLAHTAGVQHQDLILHSVRVSVILADDLGLF